MKGRLPVLLGALLLLGAGCSARHDGTFQGYLEGEFVYAASPVGGELKELFVSRGEPVESGQPLFQLDPEPESSTLREAEQRVTQAESRRTNLTKGLRPSEVAALEARLAGASADAEFAESEVQRLTRLKQDSVISPEEMDRARARRDTALAWVASLQADLETARLGARQDEIAAAQAEVDAALAARDRARWTAAQKRRSAPARATVEDTLYRVGEWVAPGRPVVALLPPENLKVRFFVPEPDLSSMALGARLLVSFDGAPEPVPARVSFISTEAEFTPPVIYSRENRAKLVYMAEARFDTTPSANLRPGQPVDVRRGP
ncbi:MAG: HlyD family efflux transporter periplasmic adaptor subunit [Verrucomicrobia bacterium]|jgi:HlyD family secretion protein|nr:HlyD family efflux transporter periplasmic adaptor subunit [Verrucomicrobiota bacterium]